MHSKKALRLVISFQLELFICEIMFFQNAMRSSPFGCNFGKPSVMQNRWQKMASEKL